MKIQEKIEIIENQYIKPGQLGLILLTMLGSFVVGSIPLVMMHRNMVTTETTVIPTEAGLWSELGKR